MRSSDGEFSEASVNEKCANLQRHQFLLRLVGVQRRLTNVPLNRGPFAERDRVSLRGGRGKSQIAAENKEQCHDVTMHGRD